MSFSISAESYVSLQSGFIGTHSEVNVDVYDNNQPTYGDIVLYPNPDDAPTSGACASTKLQESYAGLYQPDGGCFASLAYGRVNGS